MELILFVMFCSPYPTFREISGSYFIIPATLIFAVLACIGNILVFTVIIRHDTVLSNATYKFIASLNIADVLVGMMAQPLYTATLITGSNKYCWLERTAHFVGSVSSVASGVGLICVSMDRFLCIMKPLHYHQIMTDKRVIAALIYPWSMALFCAFMPYMTSLKVFHTFVFGAMFLNTAVMGSFYITVLKAIRGSNPAKSGSRTASRRQMQATRTVVFIVLAYVVCWFPYATTAFIWSSNKQKYSHDSVIVDLYYWTLALGHWNSALNVMIYSWKNTELREAVKRYLGIRACTNDLILSVSFERENLNGENANLARVLQRHHVDSVDFRVGSHDAICSNT